LQSSVVERARNGDREAYDFLAREAAQRLYPVAFRVLRDKDLADDALQRALVAIWRELPKLRDDTKFEAWSYRVLMRFCSDELRRRSRVRREIGQLDLSGMTTDQHKEIVDRDQLERAFARLSADHRAVIVLTYYGGMTGAQAASALGVAPGTVASRLHHALRSLRAALEADNRTALRQAQP